MGWCGKGRFVVTKVERGRTFRARIALQLHLHAREERQLLPDWLRVLRRARRSKLGHARHDHGGAVDRQLVRSAQADLNYVAANERGLTAICAVPGSDVLLRGDLHVGVEHGELPLAHLILQRLLLTVGHGENRQLVQRSLHQRPGSALAWAHPKRRDTGGSDEG